MFLAHGSDGVGHPGAHARVLGGYVSSAHRRPSPLISLCAGSMTGRMHVAAITTREKHRELGDRRRGHAAEVRRDRGL